MKIVKCFKKARWLIPLIMLMVLLLPTTAYALTSQNVTVTATPSYIAISNSPATWAINDVAGAGGKTILVNTQYYSNPLGDTTIPSDPVVDGECRFTVTNTSSIITDLTVAFPNHTGGDASTNSDLGTNGATTFGAYGYCTGMTYSSGKVVVTVAGAKIKDSLGATTNIKWGLAYKSQSNAWTSGTAMSSTVVITATAH